MKHLSSFLKSTVLLLLSVLVFLSLVSYSPKDISLLSSPTSQSISNFIGIGGAYLAGCLFFIFGFGAYFFPFYFLFSAFDKLGILRFSGLGHGRVAKSLAFSFFLIFLSAFIGLIPKVDAAVWSASGLFGFFIAGFFKKYLGVYGSFITVFLLMAVNAILLFGFFFIDFFKVIGNLFEKIGDFFRELKAEGPDFGKIEIRKIKAKIKDISADVKNKLGSKKPEIKVYAPKLDTSLRSAGSSLSSGSGKVVNQAQVEKKMKDLDNQARNTFNPATYKLPDPSMLKVPPFPDQKETKESIEGNIKGLEAALASFDVAAKVVSVQKGPVVTMYELQPQSGVKIQKIAALADDIALAMKSSAVRIVAPIPGRGTVGVEIPNLKKHFVFLREVLEEKEFIKSKSNITLVIGKDVSGNPIAADLGDMPHLLIAGATGAGKTVCVNSLISSILFKARPDQVKFILVDPKMVELACFAGIPHLIHPIITDAKKAFYALNWAVGEMERRYKVLAEAGVRNITFYNKGTKQLSYIVIIVDELADLMLVARESIETAIQRLAQLSRAVGIHLVLATQRPSVDVITGIIKANFPARISFKVATRIDSRTVLDSMGAEKLLGKGDLLFLKPGAVKLIRAQGSYIDDEDIEKLTNFVRAQGKPTYEEAIVEGEKKGAVNIASDDLFEEAVKIVLRAKQASGSILQRRLRVGYTRAARLLDLMEQEGIVGPFCGSKAREIIVDPERFLSDKGWS